MKPQDYPEQFILPYELELKGMKFGKGVPLRTVFMAMDRWRNELLSQGEYTGKEFSEFMNNIFEEIDRNNIKED